MDSTETIITVATWGYQPSGAARIFDLAPGEALPDGWDASPSVINDPALASAEALSAAAQPEAILPSAPLRQPISLIRRRPLPATAMWRRPQSCASAT
ncbi:hypothetical protein [Methylorubrum extorquens]|uniref:Uncharacterized protein n=1 Tax=Methylorubrum extorquens (strain CM4 / NCIMB 13688) TaxID=440085 RepID=B7KXR9_METC4|nr:hypothetical protein [Methylorubrum extorquens]ACK84671.1 hypothetical protein Mchl_3859 [Methylorubrum extorquens CM4]